MPHGAEDFLGGGRLDDPARVHDVDPVGAPGDDAHVVGHQKRRHPEPLLEVVEQRQDLGLDRHVERRRRLVGQQDLRLARERDRDHHALAQAARELVRILLESLLGPRQADKLEHLECAIVRLLARRTAVQPYRLGHLLTDLLGRIQR